MENIMHKYTKEKMEENEKKLFQIEKQFEEEKSDLKKKLSDAIEFRKHTNSKAGFIYIAVNLKDVDKKIFKVGETINKNKRLPTMNTCEPDGCFQIIEVFSTTDRGLSEKLIHTYLDSMNTRYNKEFFTMDLKELIGICKVFTKFIDNINSSNMDEMYAKLVMIQNMDSKETNCMSTMTEPSESQVSVINNTVNNDSSSNININVQVPPEEIKRFKYFTIEDYKQFVEEKVIQKVGSFVLAERLREAFSKWTNDKNITSIMPRAGPFFTQAKGFQSEFKDVMEDCLNIAQTRIAKAGKLRGFNNVDVRETFYH